LAPGQQEQRELSQAGVLQQEGQYSQALALYEEVLSQDPGNSGALSEAGWLEFEAGILGGNEKSLEQGESNEQSAVAADPGLPSARAYLGSMYFIEGELAQAVVQYGEFLADKPTAAEMSPFLPDIKKAFSETTTPLPAIAGENSASRTSGSQKPAKKK
jgi:tetratricopeptide (TPR) repeat protein